MPPLDRRAGARSVGGSALASTARNHAQGARVHVPRRRRRAPRLRRSAAPAGSSAAFDGRTYVLRVPDGYDGSRPLPLVVAMHRYDGSGRDLESFFGLDPVADERGFFIVYPDGTVDAMRRRFFNATDACCDFYGTGVDDVAFIGALVNHLESTYAIDPARVYAVGYSNGGFMSYRLACDLSPRFAAIVSLEGARPDDGELGGARRVRDGDPARRRPRRHRQRDLAADHGAVLARGDHGLLAGAHEGQPGLGRRRVSPRDRFNVSPVAATGRTRRAAGTRRLPKPSPRAPPRRAARRRWAPPGSASTERRCVAW